MDLKYASYRIHRRNIPQLEQGLRRQLILVGPLTIAQRASSAAQPVQGSTRTSRWKLRSTTSCRTARLCLRTTMCQPRSLMLNSKSSSISLYKPKRTLRRRTLRRRPVSIRYNLMRHPHHQIGARTRHPPSDHNFSMLILSSVQSQIIPRPDLGPYDAPLRSVESTSP